MLQADIEKLAAEGKPIPKDLPPAETMLYYMLTGLYARYQVKKLSKEEARQHKQRILSVYKSFKDDYEQFTSICKEYQERIKLTYTAE